MTPATVEEHDISVAITQSLEHMVSVARQATIRHFVGNQDNLIPFLTPNSRVSYITDGRIHWANPKLKESMMRNNPYFKKVLHIFIDKLSPDLFEGAAIKNKKSMRFKSLKDSMTLSKKIDNLLSEEA